MTQWRNSPGLHCSCKAPREEPLQAHVLQVHQNSDSQRDKTQWQSTPHCPAQHLILAQFAKYGQWIVHCSGSPESWAWAPALPWSLTDLGKLLLLSGPVCSAVKLGEWVRCLLALSLSYSPVTFWACQLDTTARKTPEDSRRVEQSTWGLSLCNLPELRSSCPSCSEQQWGPHHSQRWPGGRDSWLGEISPETGVERNRVYAHGEGVFKSNPHPQLCPSLFS